LNANSVVNLTLSVTDQFSGVTQKLSAGITSLIAQFKTLAGALLNSSFAVLQWGNNIAGTLLNVDALNQKIGDFKARLRGVGVDLDEISASLNDFSANKLTDTLSTAFVPLQGVATGLAPALGTALAGIGTAARGMSAQTISALNTIDAGLLKVLEKAERIPARLAAVSGGIAAVAGNLSGVREPLTVFETIRSASTGAASSIFQLTQEIGLFGLGIQALSQLVNTGPFAALIGQNVELQQQLLSTQATLAATNSIVKNGIQIKDPTEAIKALAPTVAAAIKQLEKGSLELSNVTSKDLVPIFSIVAAEAGRIGASLSQATDLSLSFAASLGTLGIPLFQANQEIRSILTGTIDYNSRLAISLNINSAMVAQWRSQGVLVEKLTERLKALREGNKLAADSVGNIGSNIQDIVQIIQRTAGASFVEPIVKQLREVFVLLDRNKEGITSYIKNLVTYAASIGGAIKTSIVAVATALQPILVQIPEYLFKSLEAATKALSGAIASTITIFQPLITLFALLAQAAVSASGPLLQLFLQFKTLQFAIGASTTAFGLLFQIVEPIGSVLFLLAGRANGLVSAFTALGSTVGVGSAGFLLLGQRLNLIPGAAAKVASSIPLIGPAIAAIIPSLAGLGVGLVGLAGKFPVLGIAFKDLLASAPRLLASLSLVAGRAGFAGLSVEILKASASMTKYATTTALTTKINELFASTTILAGEALRAQILKFALLGGSIAIAGVAINELILKNKDLLKTLAAFGDFLKGLTGVIYNVLASPITYLTTAIVGLSAAIALKLLPTLALTKIALLDGLLVGFDKLLPAILKFAAVMSSLGFVQAALAAQSFGIALETLVTSAAAGTLTIGGLTTGIGAMAVAAAIALAPLALLVGGVIAIGKAFEYSTNLVENGGQIIPDWITGVIDKLKGLGGPLNLLPPQVQILIRALEELSKLKVAGAVDPIIADAEKALRRSEGLTKDLEAAQNRTNEAQKKGIALTKEELKQNNAVIAKSKEEIIRLDGQLDALRENLAKAKSDPAKAAFQAEINKLESRRDKLEVADKEGNLALLTRQIAFAKKDIDNLKNPEDKKRLQAQIDDLEARKQKLEQAQADSIQLKPIILEDFGNTEKILKDRVKAAQAILDAPFDAQALKKGLGELIDLTQQQLEQGTVDIETAVKRFKKAAAIGQLEPEDRIKAEKAITQAIKTEYDARASVYDQAIAHQQNLVKGGRVDEIEGEREVSRLKKEQYKERLEGVAAQIRFEIALQEQRTGKQFSEIKTFSRAYKALILEQSKLQADANAFDLEDFQKVLDKKLELIQRQTEKITDAVSTAEIERNTAIQTLTNANSITDTQAADLKVNVTRDRIAKQLALEKAFQQALLAQERPQDPVKAEEFEKKVRASKIKTAQLVLQLAEEEERKQAAVARVIQEQIERRTKSTTNLITQQSQEYQKQIQLLNRVGDALAAQNKILEQRQSLSGAISGFLGSQLKLLADTSKTEEDKARFEKAAAVERLRFLRQEQDFARQKLEISIQQQRLQDAQALRQNQIDQLTAASEQKQSEANLAKKKVDPKALPEELEALRLDLEAKQQKILIEQQKGITLGDNATLNRRGEGIQRAGLGLQQRAQLDQARVDVAKTLPKDQQEGIINRIRNEILTGLGFTQITAEAGRNAAREALTGLGQSGGSREGFTNNSTGVNTYAPDLRRLDPNYRPKDAGVLNLQGAAGVRSPELQGSDKPVTAVFMDQLKEQVQIKQAIELIRAQLPTLSAQLLTLASRPGVQKNEQNYYVQGRNNVLAGTTL
jgi:hypothetical protein